MKEIIWVNDTCHISEENRTTTKYSKNLEKAIMASDAVSPIFKKVFNWGMSSCDYVLQHYGVWDLVLFLDSRNGDYFPIFDFKGFHHPHGDEGIIWIRNGDYRNYDETYHLKEINNDEVFMKFTKRIEEIKKA